MRDVKAGAPVGALPTSTRKKYNFIGWFTEKEWGDKVTAATKIEDDVIFYAHWEDDPGWRVLDVAAEYETMADGSFELYLADLVESGATPKFTVKGLPAGLKYNATAMAISGQATKPGTYTVTVSVTNAKRKTPVTAAFVLTVPNLSCEALPNLESATGAYGIVRCGVVFDAALVDCAAADGWTVKAAGLPAGLKYDANAGTITGVPTKAGTNTVTFTASRRGEKSQVATITLVTAALPQWAQGTFAGFVQAYGGEPDNEDRYGSATMTVAANGKISGKISLDGTNWTFSAASFATSDGGEGGQGDDANLACGEARAAG